MTQSERFYLDAKASRLKRMRRTVLAACNALSDEVTWTDLRSGRSGFRWLFVTLTYRKIKGWRDGEDFLSAFSKRFAALQNAGLLLAKNPGNNAKRPGADRDA